MVATKEEKLKLFEQLIPGLRCWFNDESSDITIDLRAGMEQINDYSTGYVSVRPNGTKTCIIRLNGGARNTHGPDKW